MMPLRIINKSAGFTLIYLMIVVDIMGILASLAISDYQTYTVRDQIAEGINIAAGAKVPIVDAYSLLGVAPASRVEAGMTPNPTETAGNHVSGVDIVDGRIDITFGGPSAHEDIIGETLSVTPYITAGNTVAWRCGNAPAPVGALFQGGAGHQAPTLDNRYLPSVCRP